jgi:V/A-type H+-transporting ATPase subunit E
LELQGITGTILLEAKESAEIMINDAKELAIKSIEKQKQMGIKEAKEKRASILKKATNEMNMERLHKIANSKITANWVVLSRKEEIINSVIDEAKKKLLEFTKTKEYLPLIEKQIIEGSIVLGGETIELILNRKDSKLPLNLNKLSKKINSITKKNTKLKLSTEKNQSIGGVMLKTSDSKIILDSTFDDLLKQKEKMIKNKISNLLF